MKVIPIPLFHLEQNYAYLILTQSKDHSFLVDPADSKVILQFLEGFPDIKISHILFTHKHWDHVGDAKELLPVLEKNYGVRPEVVLGAADAKEIAEATITVGENKSFEVNEIKITCIPVPCHTRGSLLYFLEDKENLEKHNDLTLVQKEGTTTYRGVFTGDTHFIAGCGKFFEGNAEEMHKNLTILGELPKDTFIYPGHEYTVSNLKWAMGIEWENEAYAEKLKWAEEKRAKDEYTVPSTVAEEFEINIFWRTKIDRVQERTESKDPVKVLGALREMKDKKVSLANK